MLFFLGCPAACCAKHAESRHATRPEGKTFRTVCARAPSGRRSSFQQMPADPARWPGLPCGQVSSQRECLHSGIACRRLSAGRGRRCSHPELQTKNRLKMNSFISSRHRGASFDPSTLSCIHQALSFRRRDRVSEFACRIEPQPNCLFGIGESRFLCIAVGHTPRQLRHFGDEDLVFFAPVKDELVLIHWFHLASCIARSQTVPGELDMPLPCFRPVEG